ncbi:b34df62d-6309-4606-ae23-6d14d50ff309 [Sclerotinia trifoliorum]|uniref:B34df62d-6309-4606-ae23-6d14d50ff309 n=1 Tax=Sclerotinia trifoliorum TaxID=28548 RepID=A0A8H2VR24_9HELO|nr:b34df62d-6309-4606-ae23-6d14d50ff309 [Sclerotinia trifoliorum]
MSTESFFPFKQDHPKFPAALRTLQKSFKARDERDKDILIEQVDNVSYIGMFENGCRKAFSGIFRRSSKDFCLIENMNPDLLTEFFFDIKHSINPSQNADITPAVKGVPDMRKFFFISCNYLDPEHIIVRTYSKLRGFDWNDQAQINDLNLFRQAAITEACGVTAFDEDGAILKPRWMKSMVTEGTDKPNSRKRKAKSIKGPPDDKIKKGPSLRTQLRSRALTPKPVQSAAQTLRPQPAAHVFLFRPTAPQFQPNLPAYGTTGMQLQALGALIAFPTRNQEQGMQGLWRDLHTGRPVHGSGYISPQLSQGDSHVAFSQHNLQPRMNQYQGQGFGMNQQAPQGYNPFPNQRSGMPYQGAQESYGSLLRYPTQNYFPSQIQEYGMIQQQNVQQGYNPSQSYGYVPQYISAQGQVPLQPQVYGMHQQPAQRGSTQSMSQRYGMHQQIQHSHNQMHNQSFAVHQQHHQQSYNRSTFSDYTQQASNQYNMGAIAGTGYGQVPDQMTTFMNANSHQQTSRTEPGMVAPLASMPPQYLADVFASSDMTLEEFFNMEK